MYQRKKVCAIQPKESLHSLPLPIVTLKELKTIDFPKSLNKKNANFFLVRETPSMYLLYSLVVTSAA